MKKILLAGAALTALAIAALPAAAADLAARPVYKAPVAVPMIYNWTGFYIGGHIGGAWNDKEWTGTSPAAIGTGFSSSSDVSGFLGGGQVGVNWQSGMWVFGVEGDFSWTDANGCTAFNTGVLAGCTNVNWYATVTGRVGVAFDRSLLYVKGGAAFVDEDHFIQTNPGGVAVTSTTGNTRSGWTVGAGLEYAFWDNWSAKLEYNFMDFGSDNHTFTAVTGGTANFDVDQQVHVVKFGVNYRFNWGAPIVARY